MNIKIKIIVVVTLAVFTLPGISFAQTTTPTIASLQAEIQSLVAELQALESQASQGAGPSPATTSTVAVGVSGSGSGPSASWCYTFNSNLGPGSTGSDVQSLQSALQVQGLPVNITGAYDQQTAAAVTSFQETHAPEILAPNGLRAGTGYVGNSTRSELNSLIGCRSGGNPTATLPTSTLPHPPIPCVISPGSNIICNPNPVVHPPSLYMCPGGGVPTAGGRCPPLPTSPTAPTSPCGINSTSTACSSPL